MHRCRIPLCFFMHPAHQRIPLRIQNALHLKIHVQLRPVEVLWRGKLDMDNLSNRLLPKPRKLLKRQEDLLFVNEEPQAMLRHVGDFNRRSAGSRRFVSHSHVPRSVFGQDSTPYPTNHNSAPDSFHFQASVFPNSWDPAGGQALSPVARQVPIPKCSAGPLMFSDHGHLFFMRVNTHRRRRSVGAS